MVRSCINFIFIGENYISRRKWYDNIKIVIFNIKLYDCIKLVLKVGELIKKVKSKKKTGYDFPTILTGNGFRSPVNSGRQRG